MTNDVLLNESIKKKKKNNNHSDEQKIKDRINMFSSCLIRRLFLMHRLVQQLHNIYEQDVLSWLRSPFQQLYYINPLYLKTTKINHLKHMLT
jgi:hypothetical protein